MQRIGTSKFIFGSRKRCTVKRSHLEKLRDKVTLQKDLRPEHADWQIRKRTPISRGNPLRRKGRQQQGLWRKQGAKTKTERYRKGLLIKTIDKSQRDKRTLRKTVEVDVCKHRIIVFISQIQFKLWQIWAGT